MPQSWLGGTPGQDWGTPRRDMGPVTGVPPGRDMGPSNGVPQKGPGTGVWRKDWEPDWGTPSPDVNRLNTLPSPILRMRLVIIHFRIKRQLVMLFRVKVSLISYKIKFNWDAKMISCSWRSQYEHRKWLKFFEKQSIVIWIKYSEAMKLCLLKYIVYGTYMTNKKHLKAPNMFVTWLTDN